MILFIIGLVYYVFSLAGTSYVIYATWNKTELEHIMCEQPLKLAIVSPFIPLVVGFGVVGSIVELVYSRNKNEKI